MYNLLIHKKAKLKKQICNPNNINIFLIFLVCLFIFGLSCKRPKPPYPSLPEGEEFILIEEIEKEINLKNLIEVLNKLPDSPKNILENLNYREVNTSQDLVNCKLSKFQHRLITKESNDSSTIHLTICESYINVEWEIDTILGDQISKIVKQAIQVGFFLHEQTIRSERIIDSYSGPNHLILSVYRKEKINSGGRESIILTKTNQ